MFGKKISHIYFNLLPLVVSNSIAFKHIYGIPCKTVIRLASGTAVSPLKVVFLN